MPRLLRFLPPCILILGDSPSWRFASMLLLKSASVLGLLEFGASFDLTWSRHIRVYVLVDEYSPHAGQAITGEIVTGLCETFPTL